MNFRNFRSASNLRCTLPRRGKSAAKFDDEMPPYTFRVNPEFAKITELVPGLFICGVSALNPGNMVKHGINYIVNATTEVPNFRCLGRVPRTKLWLDDSPNAYLLPHLDVQSDQIHAVISDGGKVLVHCMAGVSRSAAICLAYLTKYQCDSLRDAYRLMCLKRPRVAPNIGFWRQLVTYEQDVKHSKGSVRIVHGESEEDEMLPDVYLEDILKDNSEMGEHSKEVATSDRRKGHASPQKFHFIPFLEVLKERPDGSA